MMRQITVDFTKPVPCGNNIAGRIGEHNATELIIIPPEFLSANDKVMHYTAAFALDCKVIPSEPLSKESELKIPLWNQLTQSEFLTVQLEGYDSAGEFIGKSEPVRLKFLHSVCGDDVPADTENRDLVSDYFKNKHSHSNKDVLDKFAQDENGNPLYNGNPIGGDSGLTDEQAAELAANTEARHSHENKSILDKFTLDEQGGLLFDGQPIASEAAEGKDPQTVAAQTVAALLESSYILTSYESPDIASEETSTFAMMMSSLTSTPEDGGFRLFYAPSEAGELTYTDPMMGTVNTAAVSAGGLYEFYLDGTTFEIVRRSYTGEGVLNFFKEQILTDCVTSDEADAKIEQALKNGKYTTIYDLVNYRHISQAVPASEVSYSNSKLEDKSGTVKGALDEAVNYVLTAIPAIQEELGGKQPNGDYITQEQLEASVSDALAEAKESGEFDGADGLSAYQIWLNEGNTGTEADFIASLKGEKGDTGATGAAGADGHTPVKGTDYFTAGDKAEMVEEVAAALDGIPDYWQSALDEGARAINQAMLTAGHKKSAFLFYTDAHWNYGSQMSPKLLKYLYEHTAMTKTNFGGDIVNDEGSDYDTMEYLWDWRNQLKALPNHHSVVGNHDDGNSTNNLFGEEYVYGFLLAAEETPDIVRDNSGLYYYVDNPPEKTRYLYLDTAYIGAGDAQQAFVKNALLTAPEGWHIVAVSHIWHDTVYNDDGTRSVGELNSDASIFISMFDAFNSRTGDYADCGGWVEFCIGGHTHLDHDSVSSTGIPIVLVATDSQHTGGGASFEYGTDTEASVNGIVADYTNHTINVIRIGRGESRKIAVTNYQVSYTNLLPTALDPESEEIYNGTGYKANVRWSTTNDEETEAEGIYLTGMIPMQVDDVVRIKNITMNKNAASNNECLLWMSKLGSDWDANANAENLTNYQEAQWDEAGNLVQFAFPNLGTYKYFRLQASYIGPDSIITIGESIE